MKTFRMPQKSNKKNSTNESNYRIYGEDNLRIRHPSFSFVIPQKRDVLGRISRNIEGKWVGTSVVQGCTYEEKYFLPYDPKNDYVDLFTTAAYGGMGDDGSPITPRTLRKWDWFDNKCIIAFDGMNVYETNMEIEAVNSTDYNVSGRIYFKSLRTDNHYSKYDKNHMVMNKFQPETIAKQNEVDERMQGTEHKFDDYLIHKKNGFYIKVDDNVVNPKIGLKEPLGMVPGFPEKDSYTRILEDKSGTAIQQISDDKIVVHASSYFVHDLNTPNLINRRIYISSKQYTTEYTRVRERATTNINVSGDYVAKRVDIKDSVINRSEI